MPRKSGYPRSSAGRPKLKEELLGQIITPEETALQMARLLLKSKSSSSVSILDPCIGPGTFPSALKKSGLLSNNDYLLGVEIDPDLIKLAKKLLKKLKINFKLVQADYLDLPLNSSFDFVIMNPPYIRQEWLDRKNEYLQIFRDQYGLSLPGTANYYVYFITKVIKDLKPGGKCVCIVYDSWQSTKYGEWLLDLVKKECSSFKVFPMEDIMFNDRLVDATVIEFTKRISLDNSRLSIKGLEARTRARVPEEFRIASSFSSIESLALVRRGLRLKQANFFMCGLSLVKTIGATPFVKKVSKIKGFRIPDHHNEAALIASSQKTPTRLMKELQRRLKAALQNPEDNISILNWYYEYPERWFIHSEPPYAKILFNYYLRKRPRHIFNPNYAYADNFYGLTPKDQINSYCVLAVLNSTYACISIMAEARNQGKGLAKLQLFEYRRARIPDWRQFDKTTINELSVLGKKLAICADLQNAESIIFEIDEALSSVLPKTLPKTKLLPNILREISLKVKKPGL
ncbi:MAG: Eco57I restriction-modification methylase domain-containing protein [Candidatus Hodarchaeota archaeon]